MSKEKEPIVELKLRVSELNQIMRGVMTSISLSAAQASELIVPLQQALEVTLSNQKKDEEIEKKEEVIEN